MHPTHLLVYCPLCRRTKLAIDLEGNWPLNLTNKLKRDALDCPDCNNPIGRITSGGWKDEKTGYTEMAIDPFFPPTIYHYTSIETALLILAHKNIRFNRLDRVNDPLEGVSQDFKDYAASCVYVSCWTYDPVERILHWGRYTADRGCRLALPLSMFSGKARIRPHGYEYAEVLAETFDDSASILPVDQSIDIDIDRFFDGLRVPMTIHTNYVAGPTYVGYGSASQIAPKIVEDGRFNMFRIGVFKSFDWRDEREIRFRLYGTERDEGRLHDHDFDKRPFRDDARLPHPYIDVPLDPTALDNVRIVMGPLASEEDKLKLANFVSAHYPKAKIEESSILMRQTIRDA